MLYFALLYHQYRIILNGGDEIFTRNAAAFCQPNKWATIEVQAETELVPNCILICALYEIQVHGTVQYSTRASIFGSRAQSENLIARSLSFNGCVSCYLARAN